MKIFKDKHNLQEELSKEKRVCFVPTMGGLHKGHIYLIKKSKKLNRKTLVSIYVNPKQFNDKNDFLRYPRNFKKDLNVLKKLRVNYVFLPNYNDLFKINYIWTNFLKNYAVKLEKIILKVF